MLRRKGKDVTLVAIGSMVPMALRVADRLSSESIDVEVIDPRTLSPLDDSTICDSVSKTKRLVVADPAWRSAGVAAEIMALVSERLGDKLLANPERVCFPDSHTPMSAPLEKEYYPDETLTAQSIRKVFQA